jgi:DNA-binding transcriptional regulator YdaS (Cro superfamily)
MLKSKALEMLGGTGNAAAAAVGVSPSAVSQWPDVLPPRIADRVLAALARKHLPPELIGAEGAPDLAARPEAADAG